VHLPNHTADGKPLRVAIFSAVHAYPHLIEAQLKNYYRFHGETAFHVLHPSQEGHEKLSAWFNQMETDAEVYLCDQPWPTNPACVLGAILACHDFLTETIRQPYTHVYCHSDADLILKGDFAATILRHGNAFSTKRVVPEWMHFNAMQADEALQRTLASVGHQGSAFLGRLSGSFFERDLWDRMIGRIKTCFSRALLQDMKRNKRLWPIQEVIFPTLASALLGTETRVRQPVLATKEATVFYKGVDPRSLPENVLTPEDIDALLRNHPDDELLTAKWFSRDRSDPARHLVETGCLAARPSKS